MGIQAGSTKDDLRMRASRALADLQPSVTADGSLTLRSMQGDVAYHSLHGAVQESMHVFIAMGLDSRPMGERTDVLEVGLGSGLNLLLTWARCLDLGRHVRYTALEPFPLEADTIRALAHPAAILRPALEPGFMRLMTAPPDTWTTIDGSLEHRRIGTPVEHFMEQQKYDLVYFDAFGPRQHASAWSPEVFRSVIAALRPGGTLVTYCAKGAVRRSLIAAGAEVERLPGPPGKRHMLRATRRPLPRPSYFPQPQEHLAHGL